MQHDIGDHALLADGRSAALIDPDGNVAWLCMPRVDSPPCLLSLLDEQRGGRFTVRPHSPAARATSRRYHARSLVLETVWDAQPGRLIVDDALTFDSGALVRRLRAEGGEVPVDVVVEPAFDWGRHPAQWRVEGSNAIAVARASALTITAPGARWHAHGAATARLRIPEGATAWVQLSWGSEPALGDADPVAETLGSWRRLLPDPGRAVLAPAATAALAESELRDLLTTSAAVLCGLRSGPGGIVAAPTSSLPQWPGSSRCWDYRYCWLRDASLAGRALLTAGLTGSAADIGAFLGDVVLERWPCSVVRVDGTAPPDEQEIAHLGGYRGARPVREGNAAAAQAQLDVPGEVLELARDLGAAGALPASLGRAAEVLAGWLLAHWEAPDHGIWEIRGTPRPYTHSRLSAAAGLGCAASLAGSGQITGDAAAWSRASQHIRDRVLAGDTSRALELSTAGSGADAALAGLLAGESLLPEAQVSATLDLIAKQLSRGGLLDRYQGQPDGLADPCAPFVFPSFWMAAAMASRGRDARPFSSAALGARGPLGLWGEVADVKTATPLGNFPQVQSHAAFVLFATA